MPLGDKGAHYMTRCGAKKRLNETERSFYLDNTNQAHIFSKKFFSTNCRQRGTKLTNDNT